MTTDPRLESWTAEARKLGVEAAEAAATWVADGNSERVTLERIAEGLEDGDPAAIDALPPRPNLSGEWADEMNPARLFEAVTGLDAHAESSWNHDAYSDVLEALCSAYEDGVGEMFEAACEKEIARWLS